MVQLRLSPHNDVCCALIHAAVAVVAFAPMRVSNAHSAFATLRCQTWRKTSFGRLYADERRSSRTPSTNARRATRAISASDAAPSATISAEPWVSAVLARTVSSPSCSVISWIWRCSAYRPPRSILIHRNRARGRDMTPCSHRAWTTPGGVAHMPHPTDYDYDGPPSTCPILPRDRGARRSSVSALSSASFDAPTGLVTDRQL